MNKRLSSLIAMAGIALATPLSLKAAEPATAPAVADKKMKVVLQVSDGEPQKWALALNNARNIQTDLGEKNVDIEIVAYGPGIGMLKKGAETESRVQAASLQGVKVVACENTMNHMKLTHADMSAGIGYVPSGAVELARKQQEGYAYIRP